MAGSAQSASAIKTAAAPPGQPPVDGGGGVIEPPAQPAAGQGSISCLGADDTWCDIDPGTDYSRPSVNVVLNATSPAGGTATMPVTADGRLISILEVKGEVRTVLAFNPCSVPGGKDLPGTTVRVEAFSAQTVPKDRVVTIGLGDDTSAPSLRVVSTPARGAKVKPGDAITLKVTATEDGPSWQTGVKLIQVTGPEGLVADSGAPYGGVARSCGQKSWTQTFTATYKVPSHPQPFIRLCAITEDFAGNQNFRCSEWYAGQVWRGTVTAVATAIYHDAGGTSGPFTGYYDGTLTLAETPGGVLTGHLQVSASGCHIYNGSPATSVSSDVSGTDDGKQLRLHLITSSYHDNGINCGFGYGWLPPPPAVFYSSTTAVIPITALGAAQAQWQVVAKAATGQWTIHYHVDLICADCRAGGRAEVKVS